MNKGFTLIELIIVIAILGILTTLAYPTYQDYITRSRRTEGQTALLNLANLMEEYFAKNGTYKNVTIGTKSKSDALSSKNTINNNYTLRIIQADDNSYSLHAIPIGKQAENDKLCQTMTYNNLGQKNIAPGAAGMPTGTIDRCW